MAPSSETYTRKNIGSSIPRRVDPPTVTAAPPPPTAPLFSELAREAKDLFTKGFSLAHSLSLSTANATPGGMTLAATATAVQQQVMGLVTASLPMLEGAAVGQLSLMSTGQIQVRKNQSSVLYV